jgi:hypothetical protein
VIAASAGDTVTLPTPTVTLARLLVPPGPEQLRENVVAVESGPVLSEPLLNFGPLQPPVAVQAVAFVELQLSSDEPPLETIVGLAVIDADGVTITVALALALVPPAPMQVSE